MYYVYFVIAFLATTIGAISGFGGGVIIKPVLDALGDYNAFVIGVLSSLTVLSMALVATVQSVKKGFLITQQIALLTIGATIGGYVGKELFGWLYTSTEATYVVLVQSGALTLLLVLVLFKNRLPKFQIKNQAVIVGAGLFLGTISSFLGIGGGPFNIVILSMLFSMDMISASIASIIIILFSQITNISAITLFTGFGNFDYSMLLVMIPAGAIGGLVGAQIRRLVSLKTMDTIYYIVVVGLIVLNVYNIICVTTG